MALHHIVSIKASSSSRISLRLLLVELFHKSILWWYGFIETIIVVGNPPTSCYGSCMVVLFCEEGLLSQRPCCRSIQWIMYYSASYSRDFFLFSFWDGATLFPDIGGDGIYIIETTWFTLDMDGWWDGPYGFFAYAQGEWWLWSLFLSSQGRLGDIIMKCSHKVWQLWHLLVRFTSPSKEFFIFQVYMSRSRKYI